jgi:hypothetical protein
VTLRIDEDALFYFAELAYENWIPYQTLINLYLRDCAKRQVQIDLSWYPIKEAPGADVQGERTGAFEPSNELEALYERPVTHHRYPPGHQQEAPPPLADPSSEQPASAKELDHTQKPLTPIGSVACSGGS